MVVAASGSWRHVAPTMRCPSLLAFVFAFSALAGCKGEVGDTCKENNDCNGALLCCFSTAAGVGDRGSCGVSCEIVTPETDSGPEMDSGPMMSDADLISDTPVEDAPADAAVDAPIDATDDAGSDTGTEDAGSDAGSDAAVDAGDAGADAGSDAGGDAGTMDAGPDAGDA